MAENQRPRILEGWIASIHRSTLASLGQIRHWPRIEVCELDQEVVWLRGFRLDAEIQLQLRHLLTCRLYQPLSDGQLVPWGSTLPEGFVPEGPWRPLSEWQSVSLPGKRFAMDLEAHVKLQLVRSNQPQSASLQRTSVVEWTRYVSTAPLARLQRLQFAAAQEQVIVMGQPLPPIPGDQFFLRDGIAAPVGFCWTPALDAKVLNQMFELEDGDIALLLPEGGYGILHADNWVGASRSAVQLTREAIRAVS